MSDLNWADVPEIAGMKPWLCSYDGPDGRYSITLHGLDPDQVLNDNCAELAGLTIDGQLMATAPAAPREGSK